MNERTFETTSKEQRIIDETSTIPQEVMIKRLAVCARKEGLDKGYLSSDDEVRAVLESAGRTIDAALPLKAQLNRFLQRNTRIISGPDIAKNRHLIKAIPSVISTELFYFRHCEEEERRSNPFASINL